MFAGTTLVVSLLWLASAPTPCPVSSAVSWAAPRASPSPIVPQSRAGLHEDARRGFRFKAPKDWSEIPVQEGGGVVTARFLSPRVTSHTDTRGFTYEHKPQATVIALVPPERKPDAPPPAEAALGELYVQHLARTRPADAHAVMSRESDAIEGLAVAKYEVKVAAWDGERRLVTWVFDLGHCELAVEFELHEVAVAKMRREIESSLKSVRAIERDLGAEPAGPVEFEQFAWEDLTTIERRMKRQAQERALHELAAAGATAGWKASKSGRFTVVNHADARYAERVVERLHALLDWLDAQLPCVGPEEYVRGPILRIAKDSDERDALATARSRTSWIELHTYDDNETIGSFAAGNLNGAVFSHWFAERDMGLYTVLPAWLRNGLHSAVGEFALVRGKPVLRIDDWRRDQLRDRARKKQLTSTRELFESDYDQLAPDGDWRVTYEHEAFARFLLESANARSSRAKGLLVAYVGNLLAALDEVRAEEKAARDEAKRAEDAAKEAAAAEAERRRAEGLEPEPEPTPEPERELTEEEKKARAEQQAKLAEERAKKAKERRDRIRNAAFERTFGSWSAKDWADLDKAYFASLD